MIEKDEQNNYLLIFNNLSKYIDSFYSNSSNILTEELEEKIFSKFDEVNKPEIDLTLIKDNLNNTLIQYFLIKDNEGILNDIIIIIFDYYYKALSNNNKDKFYKWIMNNNIEHFNIFEILVQKQYPLNLQIDLFNKFLSYINNFENSIIYQIIKDRNNNIFHLCVKNGNNLLLLFLFEKIKVILPTYNILDIKNSNGMTVLHLACFYSFKKIADDLLLLGCNINEKDSLGNTPLHYAVQGGNVKLTKKLIIFGANKFSKNNENRTPKNMVKGSLNSSIDKMFSKSLFNNYISLKGKRRDIHLMLFIIIHFILKFIFFWQRLNFGLISFICFASFMLDFICIGFILYPKICEKRIRSVKIQTNFNLLNQTSKLEDIYKSYNYNLDTLDNLCPLCKIIKPAKTVHCLICKKCIENFDHHCFWLNICINDKTFHFFMSFLIVLFISIFLYIFIFLIIILSLKLYTPNLDLGNLLILVILCISLVFLIYGVYAISEQFKLIEKNKAIEKQKINTLDEVISNSSTNYSSSGSKNELISENLINRNDISSSTSDN